MLQLLVSHLYFLAAGAHLARVQEDKLLDLRGVTIGLIVKWADRIANIRSAKANNSFADVYAPVGAVHYQGLQAMMAEYAKLLT